MFPFAGASVPKIFIDSAAERGALVSLWFRAVSVLKNIPVAINSFSFRFFAYPENTIKHTEHRQSHTQARSVRRAVPCQSHESETAETVVFKELAPSLADS